MDDAQVTRIIEAVLFVFGQPVPLKRIQQVLPAVESQRLRGAIQQLTEEYTAGQRAFGVQEVAGGYQLVTRQDLAPWVKKALESPRPDSVSTASLETLAVIAYRQPITKAEIEAVRGVDVTAALDTLIERQFVRATGRKDSPGRPFLYATTSEFLRHFGLRSLEALPAMQVPTVPEHPEPVAMATAPAAAGGGAVGGAAETDEPFSAPTS